jgi:hypothetical protein
LLDDMTDRESHHQQPHQEQQPKKKKNLGRRPNPKRPDKVPIAFILPAPTTGLQTGTTSSRGGPMRDSAVPRDLQLQVIDFYLSSQSEMRPLICSVLIGPRLVLRDDDLGFERLPWTFGRPTRQDEVTRREHVRGGG